MMSTILIRAISLAASAFHYGFANFTSGNVAADPRTVIRAASRFERYIADGTVPEQPGKAS